MDVVSIPSVVE